MTYGLGDVIYTGWGQYTGLHMIVSIDTAPFSVEVDEIKNEDDGCVEFADDRHTWTASEFCDAVHDETGRTYKVNYLKTTDDMVVLNKV